MKKLLTLFAVLALTAPVFAAEGDPNVLVTCTDEGSGVVAVSYELLDEDGSNPGLANLMRGIALDITLSGGATIDAISDYATGSTPADSTQIPAGYSIFMGSIQFAVDPNLVSDFGDPIAPNTDPDALGGLGTSGATVELGSLYEEGGTAPGTSGLLFKMTVSGDTTVTIAANTTRGSCVLEDGSAANVVAPGCSVVVVSDCMAATNPDYNEWVNNGIVSKPKCWCFQYQCRGDVLGDQEFGQFWVFQNDLGVFKAAFGQNPMPDPAAGICADFAHDIEFGQFRVFQNDLAEFKLYFGQNPIPPCSGPGSGNDENPLPNSEFIFWETP